MNLPFQCLPCTICKKKWNYLQNRNGAAIYLSTPYADLPKKYAPVLHDHKPEVDDGRPLRLMLLFCSTKCYQVFNEKLKAGVIKPRCYCCSTGEIKEDRFISIENHSIPPEINVYTDFIVIKFICSEACLGFLPQIQEAIEIQLYKHVKKEKEFYQILEESSGASAAAPEPECGGCAKKGAFSCSRCKKRFYCSRECQKADWKNHKKDCS